MQAKRDGRVIFHSDADTPLGKVVLAAVTAHHPGMPPDTLRVYGSYAMTLVHRGEGEYHDERGYRQAISSGDVILVFPEIAHNYRPTQGRMWDESYFVFDGPAFAMLREVGLFAPDRPVIHPPKLSDWQFRLAATLAAPGDPPSRVARFHAVLTEMLLAATLPQQGAPKYDEMAHARDLLGENLANDVTPESVAEALLMPYETFRKRFTRVVGVSPGRYRLRRRIEAAADLLRYTALSHSEIAEALGFSDEFAFSKRFKAEMSLPPSEFRAAARAVAEEGT